MARYRRRDFLADVGRGMLVASVGAEVALGLGVGPGAIEGELDDDPRLDFGPIEPLVALMQETPADDLLPLLVGRLRAGGELQELVAAAALANARTFGGQDYDGYHALMALCPAYQMAAELPEDARALPVLKVLYRNTAHIQAKGGGAHEALHPIAPAAVADVSAIGLRDAMRAGDMDRAERAFAATMSGPLGDAYEDLQVLVRDNINVHRVVLAWRSWALLDLTGREHAQTLLRQSVRYCVDEEKSMPRNPAGMALRSLLPSLMDRFGLMDRTPGGRDPGDSWVEQTARLVYESDRARAAEAVAEALGDGIAPEVVGEALSLAAAELVMHDPGRAQADSEAKPKGSVHGASVGVHASDAANAWRNIARVGSPRNALASLVVAAYHTAGQAGGLNPRPYPLAEDREEVLDVEPDALIPELDEAVRAGDQPRASALAFRIGELGRPDRPVFDALLRPAISEDGALHAEKYYRTVTEEFAASRPSLRWRHLAALARVTASEFGHPAPGVAEARRLLGLGAS